MSDEEMYILGALVIAGVYIYSRRENPMVAGAPAYPVNQPEGSPYGVISVDTPIGSVQAAAPLDPLGALLGGNPGEAWSAGAMNPIGGSRIALANDVGATVTAPDDAAGAAALRQLKDARLTYAASISPNPSVGDYSTIRKIGTTGLSIVPPAPADTTSTIAPEPRRQFALRSVG